MENHEIEMILMKYPFYRKWKEGKLSQKIFVDNLKAFKKQLIKDEGLTPAEFHFVLERETSKSSSRKKKWFEFWK